MGGNRRLKNRVSQASLPEKPVQYQGFNQDHTQPRSSIALTTREIATM